MLAAWTEFLPLCIVRLLAKNCEVISKDGQTYAVVRPGVLIRSTVKTSQVISLSPSRGFKLAMT